MPSVVLAAPGRSILTTPVFAPGHPVAAVSSGIKCVPEPDMWFVIDKASNPYFEPVGKPALRNPNIAKYMPAELRERDFAKCPNTHFLPVNRGQYHDRSEFMDGSGVLVAQPNKTMCFAVQGVIHLGYDRLIFAGCDHDDVYAHGRTLNKKGRKWLREGHQRIVQALSQWKPIARDKGVEFLSWTPNSPINEFMEYYDPTTDSSAVPQETPGTPQETTWTP